MRFKNFINVDNLKTFKYSIEKTMFLIKYDKKKINEIVNELIDSNAWKIWKENKMIVVKKFFDWL